MGCVCRRSLGDLLRRAGLSCQRTELSLRHAQVPDLVDERGADLATSDQGADGCLDACHVDEAGFALTQPTATSWGPAGRRPRVPYVAPQGRGQNVIGGYFSHVPQAGDFQFATFANLPKPRTGTGAEAQVGRARRQGLEPDDVGVIDSNIFLAFVWQLAGRPVDAPPGWRRERALVVVDNYAVHRGERVRRELPNCRWQMFTCCTYRPIVRGSR